MMMLALVVDDDDDAGDDGGSLVLLTICDHHRSPSSRVELCSTGKGSQGPFRKAREGTRGETGADLEEQRGPL